MVREVNDEDIKRVNELLEEFGYELNFNNPYTKCLVYDEKGIKGVIVYDLIIDRIEIEYIIVDKTYRKKGIGSMLLSSLEPVKNITLEVRSNNIPAIDFYTKNGFKKVSIRKKYYKDIDGILMMKEGE